ncbi:flagellar basal body P-ring formation chaperone FlgA [Thorsellia anophelis]|nr:flagellar basal body P-ring formation chaperone FlgA [Thorsellia anophelis]
MDLFISEMNPNFQTNTEITNPEKIPTNCPFPIFAFQNKQRTWGKLTLIASCDEKKHYIPIYVKATGNVLVASELIQRGAPLNENNVELKEVEISNLSTLPLVDLSQINDSQALRVIQVDSVITLPMLKRAWVIKAGDIVEINFVGSGFSAINTGKALNNGYLNDKVRVRLDNKSIVEAVVIGPGQASIN